MINPASAWRKLFSVPFHLATIRRELSRVREALGRIESRQLAGLDSRRLADYEFRAFSQFGEDGILQHLVRHVPIVRPLFVEFGVESYREANTRFLLVNNNWAGLVMDGDPANIQAIREDPIYWFSNLKARGAFVARENVDALLREEGAAGEIGLLSIDIDGVDWWVWEAIESARPAIVVAEYNHRFGPDLAVTVPYRPDFDRRRAHHSLCYFGASLRALERLGARKGYDLVGCGSAGLNCFFVRRDLRPASVPRQSVEQAFVAGQFCEYHDASGARRRVDPGVEQDLLKSLPLVAVNEDGHAEGGPA